MATYLRTLAREILALEPKGYSKVHFAKIIYFVQKGLILEELSDSHALAFTRMPLGPVPVGFMEIATDTEFKVTVEQTGLSYNREVYSLNTKSDTPSSGDRMAAIKRVLQRLRGLTASQLVEFAHREPSWIGNPNGTEYFISTEDLVLPMPIMNGQKVDASLEDQKLQSKLMEGMLDDMVEDSTKLEYPNFKSSN